MAIDLSKLTSRPLTQEEIVTIEGNDNTSKVLEWLTQQFMVPDPENPGEKRMLQPGEGVEIGPFNTSNEAKNFNGYYTPRVAKDLKWGEQDKENSGRYRTKTRVREDKESGKFYLWIKRLR